MSFLTVSDNPSKQAGAVAAHLERVLEHLVVKPSEINKVCLIGKMSILWNLEMSEIFKYLQLTIISDSPSSQYRNRYTIWLLKNLCNQYKISSMEWLFSEAGHGKGAPDGVGAAAKRMADTYVAQGGTITRSSDLVKLIQCRGIPFVEEVNDKRLSVINLYML
jgi:hypothetical protein